MSIAETLSAFLPSDVADRRDATEELLRQRITILAERAWEQRINWASVEGWLANFDGSSGSDVDEERLHALYLLSQFLYFGNIEIRVLLRALYRDMFLIPLIQECRAALGGIRDELAIISELKRQMSKVRFLGVGNPSESGAYLLYFFRQENGLKKEHFLDTAQILEKVRLTDGSEQRILRHQDVTHYVFLDDICGTGETAERYSNDFLSEVRVLDPNVKLYYFALFGSEGGMKHVRANTVFGDRCGAVFEMDESYKCLSDESRHLRILPDQINGDVVRKICRHYGELVFPGDSGGFDDSQMLIGFHHNTPDNTLPVIWAEPDNGSPVSWTPIFKRYPKAV